MNWNLSASLLLLAMTGLTFAAEPALSTPSASGAYPRKETVQAAVYRGEIVFSRYCVLCHGVKADGKGRAAKLYDPHPANLVLSDKNDQYKEMIIRRGGAAMARSQFMPPWDKELTDEQIADVIAYLRLISTTKQ